MSEIPPCPFCGHTKPFVVESGSGFRVSCAGCLALGPYAQTPIRAINKWGMATERRAETNHQQEGEHK